LVSQHDHRIGIGMVCHWSPNIRGLNISKGQNTYQRLISAYLNTPLFVETYYLLCEENFLFVLSFEAFDKYRIKELRNEYRLCKLNFKRPQ
jgi:hypothetical protein